jgi:hypothetical protein
MIYYYIDMYIKIKITYPEINPETIYIYIRKINLRSILKQNKEASVIIW